MFYKVPDTIKKCIFNQLGNETNGFVFILIFRRKWLVSTNQLSMSEAKKLFPSAEMCLGKCYIPGHKIDSKLDYKINQLLCVLFNCEKKMIFKGQEYNLKELYENYSSAISLMFTFPRNPYKATKKLLKKSFDVFLSSDELRIINLYQHLDQEWISLIQNTTDRKYVFGFIDIDYNIYELYNRDFNKILKKITIFCSNTDLEPIYVTTTVSGGIHLIVNLNRESSKSLFTKQLINNTIPSLCEIFGVNFFEKNIEIGTTTNKITHLPWNPNIKSFVF